MNTPTSHADDAPDDRHDGELPDDLVVVGGREPRRSAAATIELMRWSRRRE